MSQLLDQRDRLRIDADRVPVLGWQEFAFHHVVDEGQERLIEVGNVQQSDRFVDLRKLVHGPNLHHLLHRPDAARHRNEGVGEFGHPLLSGSQGGDDLAAVEFRVRMTALLQLLGYHAMRRAAGLDQSIGDHAHQAFHRAAIDQRDIGVRQRPSQLPRAVGIGVGITEVRAAEHGEAGDGTWHGSNSELLLGLVLIRRKHRAQIQPIEK